MGWYRQMNFDVLGQQIYSCHINKDLETAVTVYKNICLEKKDMTTYKILSTERLC